MNCPYYKFESGFFFGGDYMCTIKEPKGEKRNDDHYYRYCRGEYNYRDCTYYKSVHGSSGGCFITTVLCNILGLPDNHETLNTLRSFRDNVLKKDKSYKEILMIYDGIGPYVADKLINDEKKHEKAKELYELSLKPIIEEVKNKNYNRAVKHYLYMTLYLISEYNLRDTYNALKDIDFGFMNFNQDKAGHGRKLSRGTN